MTTRRDRRSRADASADTRYDELKALLEGRLAEVEENIRGRIAAVREGRAADDRVVTQDDGEGSDLDVQDDIEFALVHMQRETRDRIKAALRRLDMGLYGRCIDCSNEIPSRRLRALPFALRCLECEGAKELDVTRHRLPQRLGLFGDPSLRPK